MPNNFQKLLPIEELEHENDKTSRTGANPKY